MPDNVRELKPKDKPTVERVTPVQLQYTAFNTLLQTQSHLVTALQLENAKSTVQFTRLSEIARAIKETTEAALLTNTLRGVLDAHGPPPSPAEPPPSPAA